MSFRLIAIMSVITVLTSACAVVKTAPERGSQEVQTAAVLPVPSARKATGPSGVLVAYEFQGGEAIVSGGGCRLRLVNRDTRKSMFLSLKSSESAAFMRLDPGTYETGRLGCGIAKVWSLDNVFPAGFRVENGSVSYVGKLIFVFEKGVLTEVKKAPRADSARAFAQAAGLSDVSVPFASAFTMQEITQDMTANTDGGDGRGGFDVQSKGLNNPVERLNGLLNQLKSCEARAATRDPLRMGRLDYVTTYAAGRFSEFKERRDTNTFSEDFRGCVALALSDFRPTDKGAVEIRVVY